jgi:hypothetical protein
MLLIRAYTRHVCLTAAHAEQRLCGTQLNDLTCCCCCLQAYQRQLLLEKIMDENEKTAQLLAQRKFIQEQRKAANMTASLHRNKVNQLMDSMKNGAIEKLAPNGTVDLAALTGQLGKH